MKKNNPEKRLADIIPAAAAALLLMLIPLMYGCHAARKHRDLPAAAVSEGSNENSGGG